jgi:hypothetical protein
MGWRSQERCMAIASTKKPPSYFRRLTFLKKLFWLYFVLLIFEGSLRKWIVPQLSGPLLVVRDPIAIWIIWEAYHTRRWPVRWSLVINLLTVGMVSLFAIQILFGGNPLVVGLYGLRSYLLPFPVLFIMGENLDEEDIHMLARFTLWLLPPMTLLEVAQYLSPSSSFLNKGAYEGAHQIGFVGAHSRASGTFSFAVGSVDFGVLGAAFIFYGIVKKGLAKTWLLWVSAFALILSVPMTGSRGFVFELAGVIACVGLGAIMGVSQFGRALRVILPMVIISFVVSLLPVFSDALGGLTERFTTGENYSEGGAAGTLIYRMITPITETIDRTDFGNNWLGLGLGRSAIAVQAFLTGESTSVAGEDDFSREIAEMGPIFGLGYDLFRLVLAAAIFGRALARAREHEPLALLVVPLSLSLLLFATPEQTMVQGFMVIGLALTIAAARTPAEPAIMSPLLRRQEVFRRGLHKK